MRNFQCVWCTVSEKDKDILSYWITKLLECVFGLQTSVENLLTVKLTDRGKQFDIERDENPKNFHWTIESKCEVSYVYVVQ